MNRFATMSPAVSVSGGGRHPSHVVQRGTEAGCPACTEVFNRAEHERLMRQILAQGWGGFDRAVRPVDC